MSLKHFLDKTRGKAIDIEEFPFLFSLLIYCGICGMGFSFIWFVIVANVYPDFWNRYTFAIATAIIAGFLGMIALAVPTTQKIFDRSYETPRDWDYYARSRMLILVIMFAVLCCSLIWFTGGMSSPFSPFYVMVFTLVLTRCALPHPGLALLFLYGLAYIVAGLVAAKYGPPLITDVTLSAIKHGTEREYAEFIFVIAAMAVPYASTLVAEVRAARRQRPVQTPPTEPNTQR